MVLQTLYFQEWCYRPSVFRNSVTDPLFSGMVSQTLYLQEWCCRPSIFRNGVTDPLFSGMVLQTLFYGGYLLSSGQVGAGDLMAFLASSQIVQRSLQNMSLLISQVVKGTTAAARVMQVGKNGILRHN